MYTEVLEWILILKKGVVSLAIIISLVMPLYIIVFTIGNLVDFRKLEWSKEKFWVEMKELLSWKILLFTIAVVILIIFYQPLDLIDKKVTYDYVNYIKIEPYSGNKLSSINLDDGKTEEILEFLSRFECRRSLSSGYTYLDSTTIFLEIHGDLDMEYKYMNVIVTDSSMKMMTGANIDYIYIIDDDIDTYSTIRDILDKVN